MSEGTQGERLEKRFLSQSALRALLSHAHRRPRAAPLPSEVLTHRRPEGCPRGTGERSVFPKETLERSCSFGTRA